jgi:serine/threonine protein kinase
MRLVRQHTSVPVADIIFSNYKPGDGSISMGFIPGLQLKLVWDGLDERTKERVCREIWAMIAQWRTIPRPPHLGHLYQCLADGSPATSDPLLKGLNDSPAPLLDDEAVRTRIHQRYLHYFGRRYADTLPSMLPRSHVSVFTHADIAPHNIMVDQSGHITGIIDWELAGWYPDYWEYANIMKPTTEENWQTWMDRTAPQQWDLSGLVAARRVLF